MFFDTEFIIALSRGESSKARQHAERFLEEKTPRALYASRICWAEVAEGYATLTGSQIALRHFGIVEIDEAIAWQASRLGRDLKGKGHHIGDNDIWIAATALAHGLPLVSNNAKHMGRIKGLELLEY